MKETSEENKKRYQKIYNDLISKAKSRGLNKSLLDGYYEKHHIVPKCLGGTNDKENLVLLTAREHLVAHELLQRIYPNNLKIITALHAMLTGNTTGTAKRFSEISSHISTKRIAEIREEFSRLKTGTKGHPHTQKTRDLISKINTGRKFTPEQSKAHSIKMKNRVFTQEWRNNISKGMKGKPHPHKGQTYTKEGLKKMQDMCRERTGEKHPNSKKIQTPDGTIYPSLTECEKKTGIRRQTLSNWIKNNPEKGYKFILK